jgi:hypothetical protein
VPPALKSEALAFRFTGDPTDKQNTFDRLDMLYQYHGRASGNNPTHILSKDRF